MKRTEQINVKITPDLKRALANIAKENDWTIAHTANRLLEKAINGTGAGNHRPAEDQDTPGQFLDNGNGSTKPF